MGHSIICVLRGPRPCALCDFSRGHEFVRACTHGCNEAPPSTTRVSP